MKRLVTNVALALVALVWLLPYAWMTKMSFERTTDAPHAFENYAHAFASVNMGHALAVTIAMAASIALLQILLALPAGYALAKLHFTGRRFAFGAVLACLLIPAQVTFVPVFTTLAGMGLVNTFWALVLPFAVSAFGTFLVRQALMSVPDEVIEAARMDGAGELTIIYRVLAPMLRPTLAALFLFSFVFHYSDYFWPLMMTNDETVRTMPVAVALLCEPGTGENWPLVMAGNVLLSLPILALFAAAQRQILRAVTARV